MKRRSALTSDVQPALRSSIPQRHFILPPNFVVFRVIPGGSLVLLASSCVWAERAEALSFSAD
jgi:hypothetical protein